MIRKLLVVGAVVAGAIALVAGPAFAHVEIEREGQVGSDGQVDATLTVPNEEADAGTIKVELVFPDSPKITDAQAGEVAGWTATVEKSGDDVESVTWTGGPVTGEDEVALPLTLGPVPEGEEEIEFTALQTYDNGDVVRWVEPTPEGGEEPEHPAPVLLISGDASAHDDAGGHDDGLSTAAIVAIVVGVIVVIVLIAWLVRRRRAGVSTG